MRRIQKVHRDPLKRLTYARAIRVETRTKLQEAAGRREIKPVVSSSGEYDRSSLRTRQGTAYAQHMLKAQDRRRTEWGAGIATEATANHYKLAAEQTSGRGNTGNIITGITRRSLATLHAQAAAQHIHALSNDPTPRPQFASRPSTQQLPAGLQAGRDHKPVSSGVDYDLKSAHEAAHSEHSTHAEAQV